MDKQKQIEEIADTLYNSQYEYDLSNPFEVAKVAIGLGYRKIPENAVVLTKEELDNLEYKAYARGVNSFNTLHEKQLAKKRKETAEKFAERLKGKLSNYERKIMREDYQQGAYIYMLDSSDIEICIDEICKEMVEGE